MNKLITSFKSVNKFGLAAILLMFCFAFTQSAFTSVNKNKTSMDYFYNGSDYTLESSWGEELNNDEFVCGDGSNEPCKITVPENVTLQDYLNTHSANILAVSDGRREIK